MTTHSVTVGRPVSGSVFGGQDPEAAVTVAAGVTTIVYLALAPSNENSMSRLSLPPVPVTVIWPLRAVPRVSAFAPAGTTSATVITTPTSDPQSFTRPILTRARRFPKSR